MCNGYKDSCRPSRHVKNYAGFEMTLPLFLTFLLFVVLCCLQPKWEVQAEIMEKAE